MMIRKLALLALIPATALFFTACGEDSTGSAVETASSVAATSSGTLASSGAQTSSIAGASSGTTTTSAASSAVNGSSPSTTTGSSVAQGSSAAATTNNAPKTVNTNAKIDAAIAGYWIQTAGYSGVANRDTAIIMNDTIHIDAITLKNKNGGTFNYAKSGKIGNDGPFARVEYEYVISGDTLYAEEQPLTGTPDGVVNKATALQYVLWSKYKEPALIDPAMIGAWKEVKAPNSIFAAGTDYLTITATTATYNTGYGDIVYGSSNPLYVRGGEIGEVVAGVSSKKIGYILVQDTVWINAYGSQARGLGTPYKK